MGATQVTVSGHIDADCNEHRIYRIFYRIRINIKNVVNIKNGLYFKETAHLSVEEIISYVDDLLRIDDRDIEMVEGSLEIREMKRAVSNSSGLKVSEEGTFADLSVAIKGKSFVSEDVSSRSFQRLDGHKLVERLTERARMSPGGKRGDNANTVILAPEAGALLFSMLLCPALCADNMLQNQSFLGGFEERIVASEELTIKDDATMSEGLVSRSFDAEGIPSQCTPVIEEGRLVGFLHDLATAKLIGEHSTGNAFRDYRNEPIVFPSNLIVEHGGKVPLDTLIEETEKGVIARGIIGAYSSDYITGDFSVTLDECSLIEDGMVEKIGNMNIGGNAFELLKSIECVSEEMVQSGHLVIPYLKIYRLVPF
jgi:PmbA protein